MIAVGSRAAGRFELDEIEDFHLVLVDGLRDSNRRVCLEPLVKKSRLARRVAPRYVRNACEEIGENQSKPSIEITLSCQHLMSIQLMRALAVG